MIRGCGNKVISEINGSESATDNLHRTRVLDKMGFESLPELIDRAMTDPAAPCSLSADADGQTAAGFGLHFPEAQWAVTPGQSAVLYDGEMCLGGGVINAAISVA